MGGVNMDMIIQSIPALAFICTAFYYVALRPLALAIDRLSLLIERISTRMDNAEERWHDIDKRTTINEQAIKAMHRRLDEHIDNCDG